MTLGSVGFEKYPSGENCPTDRVVETLDECKTASALLGLTFYSSYSLTYRPAGCNWRTEHPLNKKLSFFNTVVNPNQTSISENDIFAAVCVKGKFGIVIEGKIFT